MTPETTVTSDSLQAPRRVLATREAAWAKALARWLGRAGVRPNSVSLAGVVFAFSGCAGFVVVPDLVDGARALTLFLAAAAIQLRLALQSARRHACGRGRIQEQERRDLQRPA